MLVSVCLQSFLCIWPRGTFFFLIILLTSKLGKTQLGNPLVSKNEVCVCFSVPCSPGSDSLCCLEMGAQQRWRLSVQAERLVKEADILKRRGRLLTIKDSSHRHQREKTGIDPIVFDSKRKQWCHFGAFHIGDTYRYTYILH